MPTFHLSIITVSGVMKLYFYKGLTRNREIGNNPFCPISKDWDELGIPTLARMSLIKC